MGTFFPGRNLPGHPGPAEMLATDLEEARLCYLRAVYLAAPPARRPARLSAPPGLPGGSQGGGGKVGNLLTCLRF